MASSYGFDSELIGQAYSTSLLWLLQLAASDDQNLPAAYHADAGT